MHNQPIQYFFGLQNLQKGDPYVPPPGPAGSLLYAIDAGRQDLVFKDTYTTGATDGDSVVSIKSTVSPDWGFLQIQAAVDCPVYKFNGATGSYLEFDGINDYMEMTTSPTGATGAFAWDTSASARLNGDDYTFYLVAENLGSAGGSIFSFGGTWTTYGPKMYYYGGDYEWTFGNWASDYVDGTSWTTNSSKYIMVCHGSKTANIKYQVADGGSLNAAEIGSPSSSYNVGAPPRGRSMIGAGPNNTQQWTGSTYRYWGGRIYEYGCFEGYLNATETTALFNHLNNKHNVY